MYTHQKYNPEIETEEQWWDRTQPWQISYHEAGHAWVETHYGGTVVRVTIDPQVHGNPDGSGLTETYGYLASPFLVLMGFMAGKVCERLVLPRRLWSLKMMGKYRSDVKNARLYLEKYHGITSSPQQTKLLGEAETEVRAIVSHPTHRCQIDHLAEALMEKRTLTGDQVRAIIKGNNHPL